MIRRHRLGNLSSTDNTGWRAYQKTLRPISKTRRHRRRFPVWQILALIIVVTLCLGYGASVTGIWPNDTSAGATSRNKNKPAPPVQSIDRQALRRMLAHVGPAQMVASTFSIESNNTRYQIKTTIDTRLQDAIAAKLRVAHARYLGIVVLNPATGRILAMVSYDRADPSHNICTDNRFPAASIIKIVTTSAAIETCHLGPDSTMTYNGRKYTLYKNQLKDRQNKYTRRVALKDAFAQSINPVFGKLGAHRLGREKLVAYAEAFGFNHQFNLDFTVAPSHFSASDAPYQWAELACGFNKETTLSPLHGAMIAAAVINGGKLVEPVFVDSVTDAAGMTVYRGKVHTVQQAIDARTARTLADFMRNTISKGTARKMFRGYRRDRILSRLDLGGKTGSMNNNPRYDWFVGFATDRPSGQSVVVSAMVAHENFIGTKSGQYARIAIKSFFRDLFARRSAPVKPGADKLKKG